MAEISSALSSPRLQLLRDAMANGQADVLPVFWKEIAQSGAPLIEPIPDAANDRLVTFLWRGAPGTRRVSVRLNLSTGAPLDATQPDSAASSARFLPGTGTDPQASDSMTPLPGTDLWYFTGRFPHDLRTRYWFLVDDISPRSDPLNPQFIVAPKRGEGQEAAQVIASVLALPAAPAQPWGELPPGAAAGRVEQHRFASAILGNERSIWVYTPAGYDAGVAPYPLLLLFDGWELMQIPPTTTFLETMCAAGVLPPMVAVMVESIDAQTRAREACCHPPFRDFLADELLPWVRRRYRVTDDPSRVIVGGVSLGGLAAAYVGLERPDIFGNVLSLSGSFYWKPPHDTEYEWIARQYRDRPLSPVRFYLSVGRYETFFRGADAPTLLVANRHLRDVLRARGYEAHYHEYAGGHDYVCWTDGMADGLLTLSG